MEYGTDFTRPVELVTTEPIELLRTESQAYLVGHPVVFYDGTPATEYRIADDLVERVSRAAFDEVLRSNPSVRANYNHNDDFLLGDTDSGTLFLTTDKKGLRVQIPYDESDPDHKKVVSKLGKKIAKGMSFHGHAKVSIAKVDGLYVRTVAKMTTFDEVSFVNKPAYKGTDAHLEICRSEINDLEKELMAIAERKRRTKLYLFKSRHYL